MTELELESSNYIIVFEKQCQHIYRLTNNSDTKYLLDVPIKTVTP